jgi:hypothetical protein
MIERTQLKIIGELLKSFPVIGIIGPRQAGKTTIAKQIINNFRDIDFIYLDLENPEDEAKLSDPVLFFKMNLDKCIVLDEIQIKPALFSVLRSMVDIKRTAGRFIILGSASPDILRKSSQSLAGRVAYTEIYPFNYTEINNYSDYLHHWTSGGFPNAFLSRSENIRKKWLISFIRTYIERDIPALYAGINRNTMKQLLGMAAHVHGNVINYTTLSKSLGITSPTVKKYVDFLENSFIIRQLEPYSVNLKKRLVKSPKLYIRDSGILHSLLGIYSFNDLLAHPQLGNSWEGYVLEQIIQLAGEEYNYCFYRTHEGAECDLIILKGNIPLISVEIKYTSAPRLTMGNRQAFADINAKFNFIITPQTENYNLTENIKVFNFHSFITDQLHQICKY